MTMYRKTGEQNHLQPVHSVPFSDRYHEEDLENWLEQNPRVIADGEPLLIISRQPDAQSSGTPDLLALDADGSLVIIELKRGRTPRDVIAQALEYAAWAAKLEQDSVVALAEGYLSRLEPPTDLVAAWLDFTAQESEEDGEAPPVLPPDLVLNQRQRIILVIEGYVDRLYNVAAYLRAHDIDINIVEYLYYRTTSGEEFLNIEVAFTPVSSDEGQPDEAALLREWPPEAQDTYAALKGTLLAGDEQIRINPRKKSISFYKYMRDGRVFIGTIEKHKKSMAYWFRRDSLQGHLDVDSALEGIKSELPTGMIFYDHSENNCAFSYGMEADQGRAAARLILSHIADKLT